MDWEKIEGAPRDRRILASDGQRVEIVQWGSLYLRSGDGEDQFGWTLPGLIGSTFAATKWQPLPTP